ncbi:MAG TPA: glycosyltransferase [Bacteroidales bacterium]|nr:glycosyltransferase [Bacteroidales bacterium]HQH24450.1 glycosyltransferase [Bacteroidales bacterium]HQJ81417.1 glycosyltransferase [Bacteroidales bacterium]
MTGTPKKNLRISFVTSGHFPDDDRIFYHQGRTLAEKGFPVQIVSSKTDTDCSAEGMILNCFDGGSMTKREKIRKFTETLRQFNPDVLICSEPLTVLAGRLFRHGSKKRIRIIYDITEWYPSKKNLAGKRAFCKYITFIKLLFFNILSSALADAFIFGEYYKSRPYRFLFPFRPFIFSTYYPDLKYIEFKKPEPADGKLRLSYSGKISREKGFVNFISVIDGLSAVHHDLEIEVKITGWFETDDDRKECETYLKNVNADIAFIMKGKQDFAGYTGSLHETDIFLDLRSDDPENKHCLPIKLFYYAAAGRPVIFSDLKAIRKEVEVEKFGFLVKPGDTEMIVRLISEYLENSDLYCRHCNEARNLAETKYNWGRISSEFVKFVINAASRTGAADK